MPEILRFESERWSLVIWTRDNRTPREMLSYVLAERNKQLPSDNICFSFPLTGSESCLVGDKALSVEPQRFDFDIPEPLCYENRDYEFEFIFKSGFTPDQDRPVSHRLKEVENNFRSVGKSTRGVVNFGNNIGWFKFGIRYYDDGGAYRDTLSFRVFPSKMDMEDDLGEIGLVIDETYPLWRFSFARKTDSTLQRSHKYHESFELLWVAQFRSLAIELAEAVRLVCRSPNNRLLKDVKTVKAERITGKTTGRLEERIKEDLIEEQYDKQYRIEKKKLSFDTPENRFVKMVLSYSIKNLKIFSARVQELEKLPEKARLSEAFFEELRQLVSPFEKLSKDPLFRTIGNYNGRMRESLVLHSRVGYAKVYRIWLQLKLYLNFLGSDASVSIRSVEQLYEIWCLLEVRKLLMRLGFNERKTSKRLLTASGFEKSLKKADKTFHLHRPDGMKAVLVHEPSYSGRKKSEFEKIYSWTTTQRPDILLEIELPCGDKVRWLFDAKYRIDANENKEWPKAGIDTVPDDAINQLHRYRDSLIYISEAAEDGNSDKSRPIVGAFALYPGWFDQITAENPYNESIEAVGIGAFPLLPGRENRWLAEFLQSQLGEYSEVATHETKEADELFLQETLRITTSGMKQYRHVDLVLAADIYDLKGREYVRLFKEGIAEWYHIPESTVKNYKISRYVMREMKYCAFTTKSEDCRVCRYIYPVEAVVLKPRNEIDEYVGGSSVRNNTSPYWLIKLGRSFKSPVTLLTKKKHRKFGFRLVSFQDFLKAESWDDIPKRYLKDA